MAFSREYYGKHLEMLPKETPTEGRKEIFHSVLDILQPKVSEKYFLSSGLLKTLENHKTRQKNNGNGFGYRIVNDTTADRPLAHTILATGGSGKERNLIYDPVNGKSIIGKDVPPKRLRSMTNAFGP